MASPVRDVNDGAIAQGLEAVEMRRDLRSIARWSILISIAAFVYYFRTGQTLLYGDAVAHIHIARRLFDSLTPQISNLGSVWLPAPHLLMAPFVMNDWMWRTGVGGSIVSMVSYVCACIGMFKLVRQFGRRSAAWVAAAFFGLNANILYMQSTAMTELLYLACLIWSCAWCAEFLNLLWTRPLELRKLRATAIKVSIVLFIAMWTRYDGWFQTAAVVALMALLVITSSARVAADLTLARVFKATWPALIILAAAPAIWMSYNARVFHNPLEFWNGPYSARAIQQRTAKAGDVHPGDHNPKDAFIYFEKCAKEDAALGHAGGVLLFFGVVGIVIACFRGRATWALWLLWVPLFFYTLSIAYGAVPIFMPWWRPWSWYNVRYGLQLLPAICVGVGLTAQFVSFLFAQPARRTVVYAFVALAVALMVRDLRAVPLTLQEARVNSRTRMIFEHALADALAPLRGQRMLMYTSEFAGALQDAGFRERDVITESNWGHWQGALKAPARNAKVVVAIDHDEVAQAVAAHPEGLRRVALIKTEEKPLTAIYISNIYHGAQP